MSAGCSFGALTPTLFAHCMKWASSSSKLVLVLLLLRSCRTALTATLLRALNRWQAGCWVDNADLTWLEHSLVAG